LESRWRYWVWEFGLANNNTSTKWPLLCSPLDALPGVLVTNWPGPGIITLGSLVALPGVVLPDLYVWFQSPGGGLHFPYGIPCKPDGLD